MAGTALTRTSVLALAATTGLVVVGGAVLLHGRSGAGPAAPGVPVTATATPGPPPPPPPPPPIHWSADGLRPLLAAVEGARDEGLRPADYQRDAIAAAVEAHRADAATDMLATNAALALAHDYADGRIRNRAKFDWHVEHAPTPLATLDADLRKAVADDRLDAYLHGLLPHDPRYVALRAALHARASDDDAVADDAGGSATSEAKAGDVKTSDAKAADDSPDTNTADTDPTPDDVAQPAPAKPRRPAGGSARQKHIRASMERWRWMPRTLGEDYIWVNVPTYRLALMHGDTAVASHVVVVGAPRTPTPMLSAHVGQIIVNPWWTLPPTVLREGQGKRYAAARGFVYVTIGGKAYVRQKPGPQNALGRMKIDMPNPYAIYLHDTPAKWAFGKSERALSHGCIRVQNIASLAGELTRPDAIAGAMTDLATHTLRTPKSVPVYIVYFTAAPDADGHVVTYPDPYDRDDQLIAALDHDKSYRRPDSPAPTKRASLTPKRIPATNGVPDEPERAENAGTNATY